MAATCAASLPAGALPTAGASIGAGRKRPSGAEIGRKRMVHGARDVAGDRVDGLDRPGNSAPRRGHRPAETPGPDKRCCDARPCRSPQPRRLARTDAAARTLAGSGFSSPDSNAPPALVQALMPPSSTATAGCPTQRSIHQALAANAPAAIVIGDDLGGAANPSRAKRGGEVLRGRQRMAPGCRG